MFTPIHSIYFCVRIYLEKRYSEITWSVRERSFIRFVGFTNIFRALEVIIRYYSVPQNSIWMHLRLKHYGKNVSQSLR